MNLAWGYGSEQRLRDENQDSFGVFDLPSCVVAVVCDGMGGHAGGGQASRMAVRAIYDGMKDVGPDAPIGQALADAVREANQRIYEASRRSHRLMGMGTTVVAIAVAGDQVHVAHVGDSRVYLVRNEEARPITRDHTMVNLFVEAELLSPEDAASHPEAHVLARSLGVERDVDVDLQDPFQLMDGDALVLCSDGVHGVLTDWEFGRMDWLHPQQGVRKALQLVGDRDGDDNATLVSLVHGVGVASELPPTEPPDPEAEGDPLSTSAGPDRDTPLPPMLAYEPVQYDEPKEERPAPPLPVASPDEQQYVIYDDPPDSPPAADKAVPRREKVTRSRKIMVGALAAGVVVGSAALLGMVALRLANRPASGAMVAESTEGRAAIVVEDDTRTAQEASGGQVAVEAPPEVEPDLPFFVAALPPPARKLPHRPAKYLRPPPRGRVQYEAVHAARDNECAASLRLVSEAMQKSTDYATLYNQAWHCYDAAHHSPLTTASVTEVQDFRSLLVNFEGPADPQLMTPEQAALPAWYRAPTGGIEHRLFAFDVSSEVDLFADVVVDQLGPHVVADQLGRDVLLEAQAAAAFAQAPELTEEEVEWWARRVYVTARMLHGPVGETIREQRSELLRSAQEALARAVPPPPAEGEDPVPEVVRTAHAVGIGEAPPPDEQKTAAPTAVVRRKKASEPVDVRPRIHKVQDGAPPEDVRWEMQQGQKR